MRIITLIENSPGQPGLSSEHGLSLLVESEGARFLYDTGSSGAFVDNAVILGVDLHDLDLGVLSHHHYDHGGGLGRFFLENPSAPFYLREVEEEGLYAEAPNGKRYIGLDMEMLRAHRERLRFIHKDIEVAPGVHLLTVTPDIWPRPKGNRRLLHRQGEGFVPDPFLHELTCVVREDDGMVVLTGCGHSGVLNMVQAALDHFPGDVVKGVVGGFHLIDDKATMSLGGTVEEVRGIGRSLREMCRGKVMSGHCTGPRATVLLGDELRERFGELHTGLMLDL